MLFNKKLAVLAVLAGSMVAGSALAADGNKGAKVDFKAQLRAASCDVSSTTVGDEINWGVFTTDDASAVGLKGKLGDEKKFDLVLTNCSHDAANKTMFVYAQGQEANGYSELFANKDAKSLAVELKSGTTAILPNKDSEVTLTKDVLKGDGAIIPIQANLLLTQAGGVTPDVLNVPVTFTVSYN
ncbi:fimbrial protein [Providencia rettgeri]|uniref:fimbrial protein n=1 Tax=Providencia sp. TaxID=589 RepID=UPI0024AB605F|nr:type 1 fimbrial protein [Providencia rettgeri]